MSFYLHQLRHFKTYICWPVFSLVACFVLKIEQFEFQMFSQYVTSALFLSNITGSPSSIYEYCRICILLRNLSNLHIYKVFYEKK